MKILSRVSTTKTIGLFRCIGFGTTIPVVKYRAEFEIGVNESCKVVFDITVSQKPHDYMRTEFVNQLSGPEPTTDQQIEMTRLFMQRHPDNPRRGMDDADYFDIFYERPVASREPIERIKGVLDDLGIEPIDETNFDPDPNRDLNDLLRKAKG